MWVCFGLAGSTAAIRSEVGSPGASCASPLATSQADGDEERGCCILITEAGPRCTYASRGYCTMRATEAEVQFEFHTVASCSDLPQCHADQN